MNILNNSPYSSTENLQNNEEIISEKIITTDTTIKAPRNFLVNQDIIKRKSYAELSQKTKEILDSLGITQDNIETDKAINIIKNEVIVRIGNWYDVSNAGLRMLYDRKFFQYILDDFPEITNSKEVQTALQQKTVNGIKIGKPNETITSYLKLETFMLPELFNIAKERVLSSDPEIFRVKKKFLEKPSSKMLENTDFSLEEFIQLNTEEMKQTVPKEQWYLGSRDMAGIYYFFENDDIVSHVPLSSFISDPKIEPYIRIYVQVSLSYGGGDRLGDPLKREDLRDYIVSSPDLQKEIKNIIVTEGQCFYSAEDETQDIKSIFLTALEFASQEVLSSDEVQKILMKSGKGLDTYVSLKEELENEINEEKNNHFKNDLIATIKNSASSIDKLFNSNQEKYFFSVMSEEERRKIIESSNFQDAVKEGVYSFADAIEKSPYKGTALTNKFYDIVKYCATKETLDEMLSASPWVKVAYNGGNFNINNFKHK